MSEREFGKLNPKKHTLPPDMWKLQAAVWINPKKSRPEGLGICLVGGFRTVMKGRTSRHSVSPQAALLDAISWGAAECARCGGRRLWVIVADQDCLDTVRFLSDERIADGESGVGPIREELFAGSGSLERLAATLEPFEAVSSDLGPYLAGHGAGQPQADILALAETAARSRSRVIGGYHEKGLKGLTTRKEGKGR